MSLRLYVVRHGETEWSRAQRFSGRSDSTLTPEGERQAGTVAAALAEAGVTALYASPLGRARASAAIVGRALGLEVALAPAFAEMGFGDWEGLDRDEVARRWPDDWALWQERPERLARPGLEPLAAVAERVRDGMTALRSAAGREVAELTAGTVAVLVTHAIVTRLLVLDALGLGPERLWSIEASPAGITEVEYRDGWTTLHRVNTRAHLVEVGA